MLVGRTTPDGEPAYGRGFLTHYSDRIRNEAGVPTMVGGYLTTSNDVNRADNTANMATTSTKQA